MNKQDHAFGHWLFSILACLLLTACGSGGDDQIPLQGVSSYQLIATPTANTIAPNGTATISISLRDGSGNAAANQSVSLSKTGPASLNASALITDASGNASATLSGAGAVTGDTGTVNIQYVDSTGSIAKRSVAYTILDSDSISLSLSKGTVNSGSGDSVTLTAFVTDSSGQAQSGKTVTFGVSGGIPNGSIDASTGNTTDVNGRVSVKFLPSTTDRSNKTVTVTASVVGGASESTNINVVGTTLQITSPSSSATLGDVISIQGSLKDGNGSGISAPVTISSPNLTGGSLSITTLANGSFPAISATLTSATGGVANFTATGQGATSTLGISVSGTSFKFTTPASATEIEVGTPTPVSVTHLNNGVAQAGTVVFFSNTLGTVSSSTATTNASGVATVNVTSSSAGQAAISANTAGGALQTSLGVLFVSKTPATISVQAGQTGLVSGGQTPITATVLDAASNPVKGMVIEFTIVTDPSSSPGLSAGTAITDAAGKAVVSYTAGPVTTATNAVEIHARVQSATTVATGTVGNGNNAFLTVGGVAQFVSITGGNTIQSLTDTIYADPRGIVVTDSQGAPVANKTVTLSVIPTEYYKGQYVFIQPIWQPAYSATCTNEDTNTDGNINAGEDLNGNGRLDPGNPVTLSNATVTTNAQGIASFSVIYGKNYANWVRVRLKATTGVTGTESVAELIYNLPAQSSDVNKQDTQPPGGLPSAFGIAATCTNPN